MYGAGPRGMWCDECVGPPPPPRAMEVHPLWNNASKEDEFKKKTEICSSACIPFC